ncbi:YuiB family protein [Aquibacillus rhizosphaerae]|uniref:YuiB family protein n=1 Tax=Aquibacillus rhizosphaerae TaxID=3051431 RepID=A0ABT7L9I5_9BACI|nr:YuiB family protein [Aquibacillus sp. LR5S19]MDL4842534.1 YuiB family protein [Aquibacillus sp. LR5S19]
MIQFIVSLILFFVLFFGIAFILNMLLRQTWIMSFVYPIVVLLIVDDFPMSEYFTNPAWAFSSFWNKFVSLNGYDIVILLFGFLGTIVSGIVIQKLRKNGYQMF